MINESTTVKLHEMKLKAMVDEFERQLLDQDCLELSFEERLAMMVDCEYSRRASNRLERNIKSASFPIGGACIEDIDYQADRKLDKGLIQRLASCAYIGDRKNIIVLGATGAGKTYLSNALGMSACRQSFSVKYVRLHDMLSELLIAREEGYYSKLIKQYRKVNLLILDEWLLFELNNDEVKILLDIIEYRTLSNSTMFCSQFDTPGWHEKIGDQILADSICDRIIHSSYVIKIEGKDSMRKKKSK